MNQEVENEGVAQEGLSRGPRSTRHETKLTWGGEHFQNDVFFQEGENVEKDILSEKDEHLR